MATEKNSDMDDLISDFSRFYILTILYEGPAHGYSIISRFKKRVHKKVSPSLVYPFLQQLEEKGLVKHMKKPVGEKERKVFELTEEGRALCKVYEGGYREIIDGKELAFCCMHCARSYKETKQFAKKAT
jgi:PadR family transcriptional regulator PadR